MLDLWIFFKKQISSKSVSTGQTNLSEDEIKKGIKRGPFSCL